MDCFIRQFSFKSKLAIHVCLSSYKTHWFYHPHIQLYPYDIEHTFRAFLCVLHYSGEKSVSFFAHYILMWVVYVNGSSSSSFFSGSFSGGVVFIPISLYQCVCVYCIAFIHAIEICFYVCFFLLPSRIIIIIPNAAVCNRGGNKKSP